MTPEQIRALALEAGGDFVATGADDDDLSILLGLSRESIIGLVDDLATARETIARLNRRCQKAESALGDKLTRAGLFNAGLGMYIVQRDAARDERDLWKATSDAHASVIEQDLVPLRVLFGDPSPVGGTIDLHAAIVELQRQVAYCHQIRRDVHKCAREHLGRIPIDTETTELMIAAIAADRDRLRDACAQQNDDVSQTLGKALGYPWFKDDQVNFPGSTEEHGVCVGEHVAETLAEEAARRIKVAETLAEEAARRIKVAEMSGLRRALGIVASEPELPGPAPQVIAALFATRTLEDALRCAVRATKRCIAERIETELATDALATTPARGRRGKKSDRQDDKTGGNDGFHPRP